MGDIAGQISRDIGGFSFNNLSNGVNDPEFGSDLERIFVRDWQKQVRTANQCIFGPLQYLFRGIEQATVQAKTVPCTLAGATVPTEQIRASWIGGTEFPPVDQCLDNSSIGMMFNFSVTPIIDALSVAWNIMVGSPGTDFGRVGINKFGHDPTSPVELTDLKILFRSGVQQGGQWVTVINGVYHSPDSLPNVPFTLTNIETLAVRGNWTGDTGGQPPDLTYNVSQNIEVDTGALQSAIDALGFFIGAALPFGVPGGAALNSFVQQQIMDALPASAPLFNVLCQVVKALPLKLLLPGTSDVLAFPCSSIDLPSGVFDNDIGGYVIARLEDGNLTLTQANSWISAVGFLPYRLRRTGEVAISGPDEISFDSAHAVTVRYTGEDANGEAVNPTFEWSVVDPNGKQSRTATLGPPSGNTIDITFLGPYRFAG